jgi:hypothetical protein
VKKDPEVKSWEEQPYSIQNMAIDEEYGFGILNEGQAIACARYIKVRPNEFVMPARTVFNLSESGSTYEDVDSRPCHRRQPAGRQQPLTTVSFLKGQHWPPIQLSPEWGT